MLKTSSCWFQNIYVLISFFMILNSLPKDFRIIFFSFRKKRRKKNSHLNLILLKVLTHIAINKYQKKMYFEYFGKRFTKAPEKNFFYSNFPILDLKQLIKIYFRTDWVKMPIWLRWSSWWIQQHANKCQAGHPCYQE